MRFRMASPLALLCFVFYHCAPFANFLEERLVQFPSSEEHPWKIVLYCDEVHPGDQLGGKKLRKSHAIYFAIKEFGPNSREFLLIVSRHSLLILGFALNGAQHKSSPNCANAFSLTIE